MPGRIAPVLLLLSVAATAGMAGEPAASQPGSAEARALKAPHTGPRGSAEDFFRDNPWCASVTDGCIICMRKDEGLQCSTPGMACVQGDYACTWPARGPKRG